MTHTNEHGHPIGHLVTNTQVRAAPSVQILTGQHVQLRKTKRSDAPHLHDAFAEDPTGTLWTYLPIDRPDSPAKFETFIDTFCMADDPWFFTVWDHRERALGFASYLRISPKDASIEVGWIGMSPRMRRSVASTETMYLMMNHAFSDLGYRRYEWKCDALNAPSRAAAERLGFTYEGTFRQATHYKGRNRDTAWFSILDHEWPEIDARFKAYLDPANFTDGVQKMRLRD